MLRELMSALVVVAGVGVGAAAPVVRDAPMVPETPLRVVVVDSAGKPCGEVPVAIVIDRSLRTGIPREAAEQLDHGRRTEFMNVYVTMQSSGADGTATFDLAALALAPQGFEACVVRLGLPTLDPVQVEFDPQKPPAQPLRLTRPDCGSVRVEVPGVAKGTFRLRAIVAGEPLTDGFWNDGAPNRFAIVDGVALVPQAPLGLEFGFEANWEGLPLPLVGRFRGPKRAGEETRFAPPTLDSFPGVRGRLVDDEGRPVAERKFRVQVDIVGIVGRGGGGGGGSSADLVTDRGGRFELPLQGELPKGCKRVLHFSVEPDATAAANPGVAKASADVPAGPSEALVDLAKAPPTGPFELGDVVLVAPGSLGWLARLSDDELQQTYEKRQATAGTRRIDVEACLLDMARRKTERWKKYLAAELEKVRPPKPKKGDKAKGRRGDGNADDEDDETARSYFARDQELALLTALRRAQGKPDPLAIELVEKPPFDGVFPDAPSVLIRLKNVDAAKETFGITSGGSYRSGRFARLHVGAVDADGVRVPVRTQFGIGIGGGMSSRDTLEPGETMGAEVKLQDFIDFQGPGNFEVRIAYHDEVEIANEARIDSYVVAWSPKFQVRIKPQPIVVARATVDALKQEFRAIDFSQKVPLVSGHWRAGLRFEGDALLPEDKLFRAGWVAVPALLELLDDATLTIEQRSWVFGLLWDITGMNNPTTGETHAAVKDPEWFGTWPTAVDDTRPGWNEFGKHEGGGWPDHQKALTARWKAMKSWFDIKITK